MRWFRRRNSPREVFQLHRADLLKAWFTAAAVSGSPRGLTWLDFTEVGGLVWVYAATEKVPLVLVPMILQFEPVVGGPLEDVPEAREPRPVVAVFRWNRKGWIADDRAYFNLSPLQMIERSGGTWVAET